MTGEDYKEFDDVAYSQLRRRLLRNKGGEQQRDFLKAVRNDGDFLHFVGQHISTQGSQEAPLCPERLTENEFKQPPANTEVDLYSAWSGLTPRVACRTTFWAHHTCRHIQNSRISAVYLATDGGTGICGAERIDRVLQGNGDSAAQPIDHCVRTVLRRLGGLPEARGNRTVYVDCPLARAWWRERLVCEVSNGDPDRAGSVREVTRITQTYWEELVTLVVSRNSVLGSHSVRNTFILSLADLMEKEPDTPLRLATNLRIACRMIGVMQASRELSILDQRELRTLIDKVVEFQHVRANIRDPQS